MITGSDHSRQTACWPNVRLEEVCSIITDGTHQTPTYTEDGITFLSAKNVVSGKIDWENVKRIPSWLHSELHKRLSPQTNDILLAKNGTTGVAAIVDRAITFDIYVSLALLRPNPGIHPKYLHRVLNSPLATKQFNKSLKGIGVPNLHLNDIRRATIPIPPLAEQQRIAAILDKAEELKTKRRAALAKLDSLSRAIFEETLAACREHLKDKSLVEVAEGTRGSFVNGPFGSDLLTSELQDHGVPVVYIRDIRSGEYQRVSTVFVSESKAQKLAVCCVQPGDVLIAKVGDPPGVAAIYPSTEPNAIVTQDVIRIRPAKNVVLSVWIVAYLNSSVGRWKISGITIEATRARFSLGDFKKLKIELPPFPLQQEFACRIAAVEKLKIAHRAALAELDALFASLQHRAFRGEL